MKPSARLYLGARPSRPHAATAFDESGNAQRSAKAFKEILGETWRFLRVFALGALRAGTPAVAGTPLPLSGECLSLPPT